LFSGQYIIILVKSVCRENVIRQDPELYYLQHRIQVAHLEPSGSI